VSIRKVKSSIEQPACREVNIEKSKVSWQTQDIPAASTPLFYNICYYCI